MLKHCSYFIGAGLAAGLIAGQADARVACNSREEVVKALSQQFAEVPIVHGLTQSGQLMEMFASTEGTWTLILSLPTGQSCLVANGDDFDVGSREVAAKQPEGPREGISLSDPRDRLP
jgi:hypothetical protein